MLEKGGHGLNLSEDVRDGILGHSGRAKPPRTLEGAIVRIVERPAACGGEILNVGNPANDVTIRALAEALADVYAARLPGEPAGGVDDFQVHPLEPISAVGKLTYVF